MGDGNVAIFSPLIIVIIHVFSCINICRGSKKLFEPEAAKSLFLHFSNDSIENITVNNIKKH